MQDENGKDKNKGMEEAEDNGREMNLMESESLELAEQVSGNKEIENYLQLVDSDSHLLRPIERSK